MKHVAVVTKWDAIIAVWLMSGLLSPLFMSIQVALSVYWTFFASIWMETYSEPLQVTVIGALGVLFHLALFQVAMFLVCDGHRALESSSEAGLPRRASLEVRPGGLLESTRFNETLHQWGAIDRIRRLLKRTFIRESGSNWYVIPDCDFPNKASAEDFAAQVKKYADA